MSRSHLSSVLLANFSHTIQYRWLSSPFQSTHDCKHQGSFFFSLWKDSFVPVHKMSFLNKYRSLWKIRARQTKRSCVWVTPDDLNFHHTDCECFLCTRIKIGGNSSKFLGLLGELPNPYIFSGLPDLKPSPIHRSGFIEMLFMVIYVMQIISMKMGSFQNLSSVRSP